MARVGDGDTPTDVVIQSNGSVLRSERSGNGDGRVYAITYTATTPLGDGCIDKTVKVGVPHDQGKGATLIDSGQQYDASEGRRAGPRAPHISELVGAMKKPLATGVVQRC